jgi:chromosome partitioning protein
MEHGGQREGAGRKKINPTDRKVKVHLNVDPKVREWIIDSSNSEISNSQFVNEKLKFIMQLESNPKIIAVVNQAGGVSKTTMTMNIGYHLAKRHHRVLLVDLDPQASLTDFMGLESYDLEHTIAESLLDEDISLVIHSNLHSMDLAPCNLDLSAAEFQLATAMAREMRLKYVLDKHLANYDFILIDCPPNLGVLSLIALSAATHVLVPIQTQYKTYRAISYLLETIRKVRGHINPNLKIAGFIPTLHAKTNQNLLILEGLTEQLAQIAPLFPPIPRATAFADASMAHKPLAVFDRSHLAVAILDSIAQSLEKLD